MGDEIEMTVYLKYSCLRLRHHCDNLQAVSELHEVLNRRLVVGRGLRKSKKIREILEGRVIGRIFVWLSICENLVEEGGGGNNSPPSAS